MYHLGLVVSLGELKLILSQVKDGMVCTRHPASPCNTLKQRPAYSHKYKHHMLHIFLKGNNCSENVFQFC